MGCFHARGTEGKLGFREGIPFCQGHTGLWPSQNHALVPPAPDTRDAPESFLSAHLRPLCRHLPAGGHSTGRVCRRGGAGGTTRSQEEASRIGSQLVQSTDLGWS